MAKKKKKKQRHIWPGVLDGEAHGWGEEDDILVRASDRHQHSLLHQSVHQLQPVARVLDETCSAKPAQRSSHTGPSRPHYRIDTVPAYADWCACTATPLSGVSCIQGLFKIPATGNSYVRFF